MAARETVKAACKNVKPLMSTEFCEARRRALGLYRAFYRYIPYITFSTILATKVKNVSIPVKYFDIPKSEEDCRWKLREYFYKNACVTDIRVLDLLVIKGYMELKEVTHQWQQKGHIMAHWNPSRVPRPRDFLEKFLSGVD